MKLIVGEGQNGKTTALIKKSAEEGIRIAVGSHKRAIQLMHAAENMGLTIRHPIVVSARGQNSLLTNEPDIIKNGLLVDDLDYIISELFRGVKIKEATVSSLSLDSIEFIQKSQ